MKNERKGGARKGAGRKAKQEIEQTAFGINLRALRKEAGIKQRIIAEACGVSMQTITSWEIGDTEPGSLAALCKLADLFHVSLDKLVGRAKPSENIQTVTVNGGDYNAPVAGRDINGNVGGRGAKPCKDCAAKDRLIASQQQTIDRLSKMLEGLAASKK